MILGKKVLESFSGRFSRGLDFEKQLIGLKFSSS